MRFIDQIQIAFFTVPKLEPPDALKVWHLLYGDDGPDEFKRIPNNSAKQTIASTIGTQSQITLSCQIGRIDVTMNAVPDNTLDGPPQLVDADEVLADLTEKAGLLGGMFPLTRGALVISQLLPIEGDAKSMIEDRTGVKFPANSIDHILQYNIQATSGGANPIYLNQLSTWAIVNVQLIQIDASGANPFKVSGDQHVNHKADVNTVPNQSLENVDVRGLYASLSLRAIGIIDGPVRDAHG